MQIPTLPLKSAPSELNQALEEAGCLVVTDVLNINAREELRSQLAPAMARTRLATADQPEDFYPANTRRVSGLVANSDAAGDLILHPTSKAVCDHFLLPNSEFGYQLHVSAALEIGPGSRRQILHREDDSFTYFAEPRPNIIVASMWAISDFRPDNGGTLLVPGSHKWPAERVPTDNEIVAAAMPAGSVLFWLGSTLHGAGANVAQDWRYGVILTYSLGWVRQEENQYINVPPDMAAKLSPELRDMIGYKMYRALGFANHKIIGTPDA